MYANIQNEDDHSNFGFCAQVTNSQQKTPQIINKITIRG